MTALGALIARVQASEGPDRELDAEIALRLGIVKVERTGSINWISVTRDEPYRRESYSFEPSQSAMRLIVASECLPRFTASLDAAAAAMPEGFKLHRLIFGSDCVVAVPSNEKYTVGLEQYREVEAEHKLETHARLIAALRARQEGE